MNNRFTQLRKFAFLSMIGFIILRNYAIILEKINSAMQSSSPQHQKIKESSAQGYTGTIIAIMATIYATS